MLEVARQDPEHGRDDLLERLSVVNARAIALTEALLLLSRADQRSFTPERVDLSLLAEQAAETLLPLAEERGVAVETSGEVALALGSPALLMQLTTNLVHNAIVHNQPAGGTVRVDTERIDTGRDGDRVALTVANTGPLLTRERVATLTEPFQRGERIRSDHGGVGLGLAIVESIARAHSAELVLEPRPAGGLSVVVRLPSADASGGAGQVPAS